MRKRPTTTRGVDLRADTWSGRGVAALRPGAGDGSNDARIRRVDTVIRNTSIRDRHRAIIRRGQPPCWICGEPIDYNLPHLDPGAFVVDHVIPLDKGGPDTLDNKRAAHRGCNRAKSNKPHAPILRRSGSLARPGAPGGYPRTDSTPHFMA